MLQSEADSKDKVFILIKNVIAEILPPDGETTVKEVTGVPTRYIKVRQN